MSENIGGRGFVISVVLDTAQSVAQITDLLNKAAAIDAELAKSTAKMAEIEGGLSVFSADFIELTGKITDEKTLIRTLSIEKDEILGEATKLREEVETVSEEADVVDNKVEELEKTSLDTFKGIIRGARQVAFVGITVARGIGIAIDQSLQLMIEAVLLAAETVIISSSARAAGTLGASALRIGVNTVTVLSMLALVDRIRRQKVKGQKVLSTAVTALRMTTF